jgi:hypothetical protein
VDVTVVAAVAEPLTPVTVKVYVPALVPPLETVWVLFVHPIAIRTTAEINNKPASDCHLRCRIGIHKNARAANALPPQKVKKDVSGLRKAAVEAAVVLMVRVDITEADPVIAPGWVTEQVGESTAPAGPLVSEQLIVTFPVKPPLGVIVTVEVPVLPRGITVGEVALIENVPPPATALIT